ncbi:MAG TPA: hypothetical protein DIW81_25010 [Planctomycetaceae bacterium]|nr:hypothetical protein [Rubinisphaera sp.]HCS54806.1 hypothetical protein [Planctomycetaceae bacterium]
MSDVLLSQIASGFKISFLKGFKQRNNSSRAYKWRKSLNLPACGIPELKLPEILTLLDIAYF